MKNVPAAISLGLSWVTLPGFTIHQERTWLQRVIRALGCRSLAKAFGANAAGLGLSLSSFPREEESSRRTDLPPTDIRCCGHSTLARQLALSFHHVTDGVGQPTPFVECWPNYLAALCLLPRLDLLTGVFGVTPGDAPTCPSLWERTAETVLGHTSCRTLVTAKSRALLSDDAEASPYHRDWRSMASRLSPWQSAVAEPQSGPCRNVVSRANLFANAKNILLSLFKYVNSQNKALWIIINYMQI